MGVLPAEEDIDPDCSGTGPSARSALRFVCGGTPVFARVFAAVMLCEDDISVANDGDGGCGTRCW